MKEDAWRARLSEISTIWSLVDGVRLPSTQGDRTAHLTLIQRYQGAVYRYLLGATRDTDAADDLFQEFAVRVLQGAFREVDPQRGRFRDYLKSALFHLVADHQKRRYRKGLPLDTAVVQPTVAHDMQEAERQFLLSWRDELLDRVWSVLEQAQKSGGQPYFAVLRFRAEHSEATSPEMAQRINEQLAPQQPYNEVSVRKLLQRARAAFADALIDEVSYSLGNSPIEALEQELISLNLLDHCRSALKRRRGIIED